MQPNQPQPLRPDQNNEPSTNPTPVPWNTVPEQPTANAAVRPQQPQPAQAPTVLAYTEQEPDTVAHPIAQQGYPQQQPVSAQPAQSTDTLDPQPAIIPTLQPISAPKKSRLGLVIASIAAGVLLLGGGAAAYVMNQSATKTEEVAVTTPAPATAAPTPSAEILNVLTGTREEYLYQAIENHMKTTYVQQDYTVTLGAATPMIVDIKGTSDFTNVKTPKSFVAFDMQYANATTGELVLLGDKEKYAKLSKSGIVEMTKSDTTPKLNQWYRVDALDLSDMQTYDPIRLNDMVNTPSGIFLVGNFDNTIRKDLITYIKENKIYTIKSSDDATIDGLPMTHYNLTIDAKKVGELNLKARTAINGTYDVSDGRFAQPAGQTNEIWVNQKTGRIAKILLTTDTMGTKSTNETMISYPTKVTTIVKPEGAVAAPKQ
jgi:hypothetical protein